MLIELGDWERGRQRWWPREYKLIMGIMRTPKHIFLLCIKSKENSHNLELQRAFWFSNLEGLSMGGAISTMSMSTMVVAMSTMTILTMAIPTMTISTMATAMAIIFLVVLNIPAIHMQDGGRGSHHHHEHKHENQTHPHLIITQNIMNVWGNQYWLRD